MRKCSEKRRKHGKRQKTTPEKSHNLNDNCLKHVADVWVACAVDEHHQQRAKTRDRESHACGNSGKTQKIPPVKAEHERGKPKKDEELHDADEKNSKAFSKEQFFY